MSKFSFASAEKKEKKPLTHAQQTVKTVLNWVVNILCVVIILIALIISILTITRTAEGGKGVANIFGFAFMPVQSDSMSGTFEKDDMIVTRIYDGDGSDIEVGQVITFSKDVYQGGAWVTIFNTHRVVDVDYNESSGYRFYTQGDNEAQRDSSPVTLDRVVATWGTPGTMGEEDSYGANWGKVGKVINTLQNDRTIYFCCIVLPLILLFVIYAFFLIRSLVINKIAATKAEAAAAIATGGAATLTEEEKRRLAEEYLASMAAKQTEENSAAGTADVFPETESIVDAPVENEVAHDESVATEESEDAPVDEPTDAESVSDDASADVNAEDSAVEESTAEELAVETVVEAAVDEIPVAETVAPAEEKPAVKKAPAKKAPAKKAADAATKESAAKKPAEGAKKTTAAKKPAPKKSGKEGE